MEVHSAKSSNPIILAINDDDRMYVKEEQHGGARSRRRQPGCSVYITNLLMINTFQGKVLNFIETLHQAPILDNMIG